MLMFFFYFYFLFIFTQFDPFMNMPWLRMARAAGPHLFFFMFLVCVIWGSVLYVNLGICFVVMPLQFNTSLMYYMVCLTSYLLPSFKFISTIFLHIKWIVLKV